MAYNAIIKKIHTKKKMIHLLNEIFLNDKQGGNTMKIRIKGSDSSFADIKEERLRSISADKLRLLEAFDLKDNKILKRIISSKERYKDFQLYKFYAKDDDVNDPTGSEHEWYLERYGDYRDITNEIMDQLVKYNYYNVDVFNEAVLIKYKENGENFPLFIEDNWPEYWPARCAVVYGEPQDQVYTKMVAAFGKDVIDPLWKKYCWDL